MKKLSFDKEELVRWAKNAAGCFIVSMALLDSGGSIVKNIHFDVKNPQLVYQVATTDCSFFPSGNYLLEVDSREDDVLDLPYDRMAMALGFNASLNDAAATPVGGLDRLIEAVADFDCLIRVDKSNPAYVIGHMWILLPEDPVELEKLQDTLEVHAVKFAFPDGTGTLNLSNMKMGRGIYI